MKEIAPGDPLFESLVDDLDTFLDHLDEQRKRRLALEEASLRSFLAYALRTIASRLGYKIVGISEFIKDAADAVRTGWQEGAARARAGALRRQSQ